MREADVAELYGHLTTHGLVIVVDGGWGVDALLGRQTRPHADLDIALPHDQVPVLRRLATARGYRAVERPDETEWNFVLGDDARRQLDVHSFTFDPPLDLGADPDEVPDDLPVSGIRYPRRSLYGSGSIGGVLVRCVPAEYLVSFHTGYPLDEDDYRDTSALCATFGIELPAEYETFVPRPSDPRSRPGDARALASSDRRVDLHHAAEVGGALEKPGGPGATTPHDRSST